MPDEDAAVVTRLRQAGAIILCRTNAPEFATGANTVNRVFGATRNPFGFYGLTAGGSTGGGGAAVASGMLPLAEGTDFGGSLRVPAAFCGVVGLRPTAGEYRAIRCRCLGTRAGRTARWRAAPSMLRSSSTRWPA